MIEVFLLCYNRPQYLEECLNSILGQLGVDYTVIVSDNSTAEDVSHVLAERFPQVEVRRRRPSLTAMEHFNQVLSEVSAPYFVIFHDDDIMLPNYLSRCLKEIRRYPEAAAVSPNAYLMYGDSPTKKKFQPKLNEKKYFTYARDLALCYFDPRPRINPFPLYFYRSKMLRGLNFDYSDGHKYSDFAYLMKALERGIIVWMPEPLALYRRHSGNDSGHLNMNCVLRIIHFTVKRRLFDRNERWILHYKYWHFLIWLRNRLLKKNSLSLGWRERVVLKTSLLFFLHYPRHLITHLSSKVYWTFRQKSHEAK